MNRYLIPISILALSASVAYSQQPVATSAMPKCPDYSLQLAQAVQAFSDRDFFRDRSITLDAMVTQLKAELKSAEDKVTADDAIIQTYRAKETKPAEPAKP